jgi:glyoxylase-like metal-dependent hydrolase (beta-lactamase superfamily II)
MRMATTVQLRARVASALAWIALAMVPVVPASAQGDRKAEALAEGAWLLPGRFDRGRQPDGNSLLLQGRDGLVIVDSGRHAEHSAALVDWARERRQPLRAVINTHWHLDHLGGNIELRRFAPGLRAHASSALRDAVTQRMPDSEVELRRMLADPGTDPETRRMVEIDLALYAGRAGFVPDELIEGPAHVLELAGRRLSVGVERGVSGGDVWVLDQASGVLAVGDFVTLPVPFFDTACTAEWQAAMGRLDALPFARVLPGHGPVMTRDDFRRYRGALDSLLSCAASERAVAECSTGWISDLGPLLPEASRRSVAPMLRHYFEQHLRAPGGQRDRYCRS